MEILLPFHRTVLWMYAKLKEIYLLVATDQIDQRSEVVVRMLDM